MIVGRDTLRDKLRIGKLRMGGIDWHSKDTVSILRILWEGYTQGLLEYTKIAISFIVLVYMYTILSNRIE
jgi:hypothetical protein